MTPAPASQAEALAALWPWLLVIVGGPAGLWGLVKAGASFARWLHVTRYTADEAKETADQAAADINALGGKVNAMREKGAADARDFAYLSGRVDKLEDHHEALPEILKQERHAIPDSPTGKLAASLDERVDALKEEHGRRLDRLEEWRDSRSKDA